MSTIMIKNNDDYFVRLRKEAGKRLKNERVRLGYSLGDFSLLLGVHRNTQRSYENGDRTPNDDYYKLASANDVRLDYVIGDVSIEDLPYLASVIALQVFRRLDKGFNEKAITSLFMLLGSNEVNIKAENGLELSSQLIDIIIDLALNRGEVFYEAWSAIHSYSSIFLPIDGKLDNTKAVTLVLETIDLYDAIKSKLGSLRLHDNVRVAAEAVANKHGALKSS